jgi:hypothetical protein
MHRLRLIAVRKASVWGRPFEAPAPDETLKLARPRAINLFRTRPLARVSTSSMIAQRHGTAQNLPANLADRLPSVRRSQSFFTMRFFIAQFSSAKYAYYYLSLAFSGLQFLHPFQACNIRCMLIPEGVLPTRHIKQSLTETSEECSGIDDPELRCAAFELRCWSVD